MTCPKCQGEMRTYERNGVHVDQCGDCRGLFLDRGELERLVEAEGSFYRETPGPPQAPAPPREGSPDYGHRDDYGGHRGYGKHPKRRRKNFLEELFD